MQSKGGFRPTPCCIPPDLTLPSRGRPTSGFAGCRPPLMSNVRDHMRIILPLLLVALLLGCAAPAPTTQPPGGPSVISLPFKDDRPAQERKSLIELEAYRT